jgi:hypothetical protein
MKTTATALAIAALSFAALSAHADDADPSGQFAASVGAAQAQRTQVQAQYHQYRKEGVNPWATSYNPLRSFQGQRTREEVRNEYLNSRKAVAAFTGEDSGSAYLASRKAPANVGNQLAGTPANAQ